MKTIRKTHTAGVAAMMAGVAFCLYVSGTPSWSAATAGFLGILGPVLVYFYGDDPPFDENGSTIIAFPPQPPR